MIRLARKENANLIRNTFCLFYVFLLAAYNDMLGSQRKRKLEQKYEKRFKRARNCLIKSTSKQQIEY